MIANGLELKKIRSKAITLINDNLNTHLQSCFQNKAFIVVYLDYKVLIGIYENNNMIFANNETFEPKYIQKIRFFDENKELLLWRSNEILKGRLRIDNEGEDVDVIDAHQVLWGTQASQVNEEFTIITEDRGTTLILPIRNVNVNTSKKRIFLSTRNYIGYMINNQATYVDCRFVKFCFESLKGGNDE